MLGLGLLCLMIPVLSKYIWCHVWPYFSKLAHHHIRHQATHTVSCQPGDYIWSLWFKHILFVTRHDKRIGQSKKLCLALSIYNNNNNNRFTQAHNSLTVNVLGALWFTTETVIYSSKRCVLISCWAMKKLIQVEVTEYATTPGGAVIQSLSLALETWHAIK